MNRRRFLAGASGTLPALLAGCLNSASTSDDTDGSDTTDSESNDGGDGSNGDDESNGDGNDSDGDGRDGAPSGGDEDTVPVLTGHAVSDHVAAPDAERTSDVDAWGLFVASRDAADEYYGDVEDEEVAAFVDDTDFEAGDRLVFLEAYAPRTCNELVLGEDPYVASNGIPTVEATVERTAPENQPCGEALTPVDLLLRLSFDPDAGPTDVLEARFAGHRDEPEELTLEAER